MNRLLFVCFFIFSLLPSSFVQNGGGKPTTNTLTSAPDEKAEAIIRKAVEKLGGERYLQVKTVVGTGNFSTIRDGVMESFTTFIDVITYPDKERTEFKQGGIKNIQTNYGAEGWIFDGGSRLIKEQSKKEVESFQRSLKTSLDNLLRGTWRKEGATLKYIGRREAGLGKRNDAIKIIYKDGFEVEFEFDPATGLPAKTLYKRTNAEGEEQKEEDRYAQFVDVQGIMAPFIVDHWINGKHTSRINYVNLDFNKSVPDAIFRKPSDIKELKKDLKL